MLRKVHSNGCDFQCRFEDPGVGRKGSLVFVHGEIHSMDYWAPQFDAFADRYACLAYNRRGHVGTGMTDFGFSVENQTLDLLGLIDHFELEKPYLVALAFGTTITANFAINHPDRVAGLAMIAWSELYEARDYLARWEIAARAAAEELEAGGREGLIEMLREHGGSKYFKVIPPKGHPFRERAVQMLGAHPVEEYRHGMLEMAASVPDLIPRMAGLDIPVMGINGTDDPFIEDPARLAGVRRFRQVEPIEGGGRFAHWEYPDVFNARLVEYFGL